MSTLDIDENTKLFSIGIEDLLNAVSEGLPAEVLSDSERENMVDRIKTMQIQSNIYWSQKSNIHRERILSAQK